MNNTYYQRIKEYINNCSTKQEINWFDLPSSCYILINKKDEKKQKVKLIKKLMDEIGKVKNVNESIKGIRISMKKGILDLLLLSLLDIFLIKKVSSKLVYPINVICYILISIYLFIFLNRFLAIDIQFIFLNLIILLV